MQRNNSDVFWIINDMFLNNMEIYGSKIRIKLSDTAKQNLDLKSSWPYFIVEKRIEEYCAEQNEILKNNRKKIKHGQHFTISLDSTEQYFEVTFKGLPWSREFLDMDSLTIHQAQVEEIHRLLIAQAFFNQHEVFTAPMSDVSTTTTTTTTTTMPSSPIFSPSSTTAEILNLWRGTPSPGPTLPPNYPMEIDETVVQNFRTTSSPDQAPDIEKFFLEEPSSTSSTPVVRTPSFMEIEQRLTSQNPSQVLQKTSQRKKYEEESDIQKFERRLKSYRDVINLGIIRDGKIAIPLSSLNSSDAFFVNDIQDLIHTDLELMELWQFRDFLIVVTWNKAMKEAYINVTPIPLDEDLNEILNRLKAIIQNPSVRHEEITEHHITKIM